MVCLVKDVLVQKVSELYQRICALENLNPSEDVDAVFTELVLTCVPPNPIDVTKLCKTVQMMRTNLIKLCGQAEGLLERHFSTVLGSFYDNGDNPLRHLSVFPYYDNYLKLSLLEFTILSQHTPKPPSKVAFLGSGPLPLTSIVLATRHLIESSFHNYDVDPVANSLASRLVAADPDLSKRMVFRTANVMDVGADELKEYDVVFLAALVGMNKEDKVGVIEHLGKNMVPGSILMLRSAHGARGFLYPIVDPVDLQGFEVLSVFHPTNEVINSVVLARKNVVIAMPPASLPCKCGDFQGGFNHFSKMNMVEELGAEE